MLRTVFILICILCMISSCTSVEKQRISASEELANEVDSILQATNIQEIKYLFNEDRSELIKSSLPSINYPRKLNFQLSLVKELLRCNKTEEALTVIDQINQVISSSDIKLPLEIQQKFLLLHATVYLRQGELQNCIDNHQETSCIIPFSEEAIHINKSGSEAAIPLLLKVLKLNEDNYEAKWLLNIAYETLGKPKNDLNPKFIINFPSKTNEWRNRSLALGIDDSQLAGGVIADDFNNDGFLDIIVSSWGELDRLTYYENNGKTGFENKSSQTGLDQIPGGLNLNQADYNNDGFLDLFVMRGAWFETEGKIPNSLIRNNGDGTFTDVTKVSGVYSKAPTNSSVWLDVNLDGNIDLFVANESSSRAQFNNELWINNGDGTFSNKITSSGMNVHGWFKGATAVSLNKGSAVSDLFLSDYRGRNRLFKNLSTKDKIKFEEVSKEWNVELPKTSFSCWAFDYNNNGAEDVFVTAYGDAIGQITPSSSAAANYQGENVGATPIIYSNDGKTMTKIDSKNGLNKAAFTMGSNFGDIDNDGYLDFYLATGDPMISSIVPNLLYHNKMSSGSSSLKFEDVSFQTGTAHLQKGHGVAFADFDRDGDQDLYTVLGGAYEGDSFQNAYFENPGNDNKFVVLKLIGSKSNRAAIGARVKLTVKDVEGKRTDIHRKVTSGSSFGGNSLQLEIGVGQATEITNCEIIWPYENSFDSLNNLEINKAYKIVENSSAEHITYEEINFLDIERHKHHHEH